MPAPIYVEGCPNARRMQYLPDKLWRKFTSIGQADLLKKHPFRKHSYPMLLRDDQVIFGIPDGRGGAFGCTADLESFKFLIILIPFIVHRILPFVARPRTAWRVSRPPFFFLMPVF
jgi:hypothetical protein